MRKKIFKKNTLINPIESDGNQTCLSSQGSGLDALSLRDKEISRRQFLGKIGAVVAGAVCYYLTGHQNKCDEVKAAEDRCPVHADGMVAITESNNMLLVTHDGQGSGADYGCRLNPVASEIWRLADGRHTVEQIAQALERKFDVSRETALNDTHAFVGLLMKHKFLVWS